MLVEKLFTNLLVANWQDFADRKFWSTFLCRLVIRPAVSIFWLAGMYIEMCSRNIKHFSSPKF
jgi:hypothetical protein